MSFRSNDDIKTAVQTTVALNDIDDVSVAAPADQDVLTWEAASSSWVAQVAGGTGWPTAVGTDYAGTPYEQALVSATNGDLIISPNGDGALIASVPDGTAVGGDTRGIYATDFQRLRNAATQVASGDYATLGGGRYNTASGDYSTAGGGSSNTASGVDSTVSGGNSNTASGIESTVGGGSSNTASGTYSVVGGGRENTASGYYSAVAGGFRALADHYGEFAHASGRFVAAGDAQYSRMILRVQTTDATPTELSADGAAPTAATRLSLADGTAYKFTIDLTARESATNDTTWREISGCIRRGAGAATTSLVGSLVTSTGATSGASTWAVSVTADTVNGALKITVTGQASHTIKWVSTVHLTKVAG